MKGWWDFIILLSGKHFSHPKKTKFTVLLFGVQVYYMALTEQVPIIAIMEIRDKR